VLFAPFSALFPYTTLFRSAWYDVWWAALAELRARYAGVIGATAEEIALAPSISVALSAVAEALDYTRRPKVVVTSLDFPTVAYRSEEHTSELQSRVDLVCR